MTQRLERYNKENADRTINPANYYFQYIVALSPRGSKMVYLNAICQSVANRTGRLEKNSNWREKLIRVDDGGECFFQLLIDINKERVVSLSVNGYA